ncbi:MAG: T9SS type A sorting domain-containing protein [bacterium]|nr:T9SS type A sorting domain-containing protein [bacterium]
MRKYFMLIGILLVTNTFASAPDTLWTRTFGGMLDDWDNSVQQTSDTGFIIVGATASLVAGKYAVYLIKTDYHGNTLWVKTFIGTGLAVGYSVQQTSDNGFIITGETRPSGSDCDDVYLVRTNSSGDTLWTRTFGGTSWDGGHSVRQTEDGGFIVTGHTSSFGADSGNIYLIRTNSSGDTVWTRTYGGNGCDWSNSVIQTQDGGFIIAGGTSSSGAGSADVYLVKINSSGDIMWARTYGGTDSDEGYSVQSVPGGFIIAGGTHSFGAGGDDFYLIRTNSSGDTLWTKTYGGTKDDYAYSLQKTSDNGFIIVGYTFSFGAGYKDVYLVRTDSLGDTLWTKTLGGINYDYGGSVQQTQDGGFIVSGTTSSSGAGSDDIYLVKLCKETGIEETNAKCLMPNAELQIIKDKICLSVPNNEYTNTLITIYDLCGRMKEIVYNGELTKGNYTFTPNIKKSGVYFVQLKTNNFTETKKLILMK